MPDVNLVQEQDLIAQNGAASNAKVESPLILRGRHFSSSDLEVVSGCVRKHFDNGRTCISRAICEKLGWKQPNGWLKDRACRDVLRRLEEMGLITLPPPLVKRSDNSKAPNKAKPKAHNYLSKYDFVSPITESPTEIILEFAKGNHSEKIWNGIVNQYHYLGHTVTVGRCIKYLIKADDKLLGALAFSSPAWHLAPRDTLLQSMGIEVAYIHSYVINNSRFLILPNVRIPNLASQILSLATKQIVEDWTQYYSITPLVAETFVHSSLYQGTCYRAANWVEVGVTKGYAKKGASYHNSQGPKLIFLYGLNRHIRRGLLKAINNSRESTLGG